MILFVDKDTTIFRSSSIRYRGWLYNHCNKLVGSIYIVSIRYTKELQFKWFNPNFGKSLNWLNLSSFFTVRRLSQPPFLSHTELVVLSYAKLAIIRLMDKGH